MTHTPGSLTTASAIDAKDWRDYSRVMEYHLPNGIIEWRVGSTIIKRAMVGKDGIAVSA